MGVIVPIVEGDGEYEAVRPLLERVIWGVFTDHASCLALTVGDAICAHGDSKLLYGERLERFYWIARKREKLAGILVMFDADGGCAKERAAEAAERVRALNPPVPVVLVVPRRMYESWFLANLAQDGDQIREALGLAPGARPDRAAEDVPNPKSWLTEHMPSGRPYKETAHQARLTRVMDLDIECQHSRSFHRLLHAVEELLDAIREGRVDVTPPTLPDDRQDPA